MLSRKEKTMRAAKHFTSIQKEGPPRVYTQQKEIKKDNGSGG